MSEKKLFNKIYSIAQMVGFPIYVVGGYVRDKFLGTTGKDIDFVVVGDAMQFADVLKEQLKIKNIARYPRFGTFMAHYMGYDLEFVNAREESYDFESRNPVIKPADLKSDLSRRDFTINCMAMDISPENFGQIIDVYNGKADLDAGIIKTPLEPHQTFSDDPLRMMRAVRFASRFNYKIEAETLKAIKENAGRLQIISVERVQDEFNKIMLSHKPSVGLRLLEETDLLAHFLPEMKVLKGVEQRKDFHHKDVFWHTLEVVDNLAEVTDSLRLRLAGLFHDIAKPRTKRFVENIGWTFHGHEVVGERMANAIMKRLKYSNEMIAYVKKLVRLHLRPIALINDEVTDSAMRRLLFWSGADFEDLMTLCRADITSKNPARVKKYLNNYKHLMEKIAVVEERDRLRNFQPPVNGKEIMELFNAPAGPFIGVVKKALEEAILDGVIPNEHQACLHYIEENRERFLAEKA